MENSSHVRLRRERRSVLQHNEFPLEDLHGIIIVEERRVNPDRRAEGIDVTDAKISQVEFQEYFDEYQKGE